MAVYLNLNEDQAKYLYKRAGQAAYKAHSIREQEPQRRYNFPDAIQEAALAFWQAHYHDGYCPAYAYKAACREVGRRFFSRYKSIQYADSLDAFGPDDRPWIESIPAGQDDAGYTWALTDQELGDFLRECLPPRSDIERYLRIIHMLRRGDDNENIAHALGCSLDAVKSARKRLKAALRKACQERGIEPPPARVGGWRSNHHYGNYQKAGGK